MGEWRPLVGGVVGTILRVHPPGSWPDDTWQLSELSGQLGTPGSDRTAGFLSDDVAGVRGLWESVGRLAAEPRPPESFPYGSPDLRRLRAGRYRIFYTIDEDRKLVQINHVARLP